MISDLFSFGAGIATGLVLVQLYPPSARVGVWILNKLKKGYHYAREKMAK